MTMPSSNIAESAKRLYLERWKSQLEATNRGQFVAIEPESESHFVESEFVSAALAAKKAFPDRKSFVLKIGEAASFHIGGCKS